MFGRINDLKSKETTPSLQVASVGFINFAFCINKCMIHGSDCGRTFGRDIWYLIHHFSLGFSFAS